MFKILYVGLVVCAAGCSTCSLYKVTVTNDDPGYVMTFVTSEGLAGVHRDGQFREIAIGYGQDCTISFSNCAAGRRVWVEAKRYRDSSWPQREYAGSTVTSFKFPVAPYYSYYSSYYGYGSYYNPYTPYQNSGASFYWKIIDNNFPHPAQPRTAATQPSSNKQRNLYFRRNAPSASQLPRMLPYDYVYSGMH